MIDWLDLPYHRNPHAFFVASYQRPFCNIGWQSTSGGEEARVVGMMVGELLAMGVRGSDIHLEYHIDPANRVDIAVLGWAENRPLLVECKARVITEAAVRQGRRYLAAARLRWPGQDPVVCLAAPEKRPYLEDEDGLFIVRVRAA